MSQNNEEKANAAESRTQQTKSFIKQVRAASRRKYTPEEKVRIVMEGFRREVTVNDLCRREGIKPGTYYAWTKDFMEAGKDRLTRDAVRDATRQEINDLKRENIELKQLVADLMLDVYRLKKNGNSSPGSQGRRHMSAEDKANILAQMENLIRGKRQALRELGIPKSSYYRWCREKAKWRRPKRPWNRITPEEEARILALAKELPELSSRQLAAWIPIMRDFRYPSQRCTAS